jgi:hypothetical protein
MEGSLLMSKLADDIVEAFIKSFDNGSTLDDAWCYTEEEYRKEYIKEWTEAIEEILPVRGSVFVVHHLYNGWTEHSTKGVYLSKEKAYSKLMEVIVDNGSSVEECEKPMDDIEFILSDLNREFSVWITESEVE